MDISAFDKKMFKAAYEMAQKSTFHPFHLGCVIVYKKRIISAGTNSYQTHPIQKKYNKKYRKFSKSKQPIKDTLHAEMDALQRIPRTIAEELNWDKVSIYIVRICPGKRLGIGLARPCAACRNALKDMGIKKIYYTTDDGVGYEKIC